MKKFSKVIIVFLFSGFVFSDFAFSGPLGREGVGELKTQFKKFKDARNSVNSDNSVLRRKTGVLRRRGNSIKLINDSVHSIVGVLGGIDTLLWVIQKSANNNVSEKVKAVRKKYTKGFQAATAVSVITTGLNLPITHLLRTLDKTGKDLVNNSKQFADLKKEYFPSFNTVLNGANKSDALKHNKCYLKYFDAKVVQVKSLQIRGRKALNYYKKNLKDVSEVYSKIEDQVLTKGLLQVSNNLVNIDNKVSKAKVFVDTTNSILNHKIFIGFKYKDPLDGFKEKNLGARISIKDIMLGVGKIKHLAERYIGEELWTLAKLFGIEKPIKNAIKEAENKLFAPLNKALDNLNISERDIGLAMFEAMKKDLDSLSNYMDGASIFKPRRLNVHWNNWGGENIPEYGNKPLKQMKQLYHLDFENYSYVHGCHQ
jgi:hypothetical protein